MTPFPEPAADVAAQIEAALDPEHPKRAAFVVPGNVVPRWVRREAHVIDMAGGSLVTRSPVLAAMYAEDQGDVMMASILGYPEHKPDVVQNCGGDPLRAKAVQARDFAGNVITEAIASPAGLERTISALQQHVPAGGALVVLTAVDAINRRLTLRALEFGDRR